MNDENKGGTEREKRCVWCGLPKFGDDRCICDSPTFEMMEQCSRCGRWKEVDHLHVPEDSDEEVVECTAPCATSDGGVRHV